jgi:hypothetical protein
MDSHYDFHKAGMLINYTHFYKLINIITTAIFLKTWAEHQKNINTYELSNFNNV